MAKHLLIEKYLPAVRLQGGINTNLPVTLNTSSSTLSVGGTSTFTGVATFTAAPVFSGGTNTTVVDGTASALNPTAAQSGTTFLLDRAGGILVTLPAPVVGLEYTFIVVTTATSTNTYKVITDAGTTFAQGTLMLSAENTASKSFLGNGTSHVSVIQNSGGSNTTGGILGSWMKWTCVSATLWNVRGVLVATTTPTTPWSTS
jgi:hypothetical protein